MNLTVSHSQRLKDIPGHKRPQRQAADAPDHFAEQEVAGVGIGMLASRFKVQLLLPGDGFQSILAAFQVAPAPAVELVEQKLTSHSTGVIQEMTQRNFHSKVRHLRYILV